jgi:hypothetical protein
LAEPLGTVEFLARELARAFTPLRRRLAGGNVIYLFAELGLRFPPQLTTNASFTAALNTAANAAAELPPLIRTLIQAVENEDVAQILRTATDIIDKIRQLIPALDTIATQLNGVGPTLPGMVAAEVQAFAANLPERLLHYVILTYLEKYYPIFFQSLQFLGIAERSPQAGGGDATHPPYLLRRIRFDRVGQLLNAPDELLRTLYGWGEPAFTGELFLERLHTVLSTFTVPVEYIPARGTTPPRLDLLFFTLRTKTDIVPKGLELLSEIDLPAELVVETPFFSPTWKIGASVKGTVTAGLSAWIQPPLVVTIHPPSVQFESDLAAWLRGTSPTSEQRFRVFGKQDGTRLEAAEVKAGVFGLFRWNSGTNAAEGDFGFDAKIEQGRAVIDIAGSDGFLGSILPPDGFAFNFDVGIGYTGKQGLYFTGSAGLEIALALHASVGPVNLDTLYIVLKAGASGIDIEISIAGSAALGPIAASVDRVGAIAKVNFQRGNLGPLNLDFGFKPPNGVGLAIDAGVVKGGGYLYFNYDKEEYAGALELAIAEFLTLKAIGLITTRMPDGSKGFSMLIIITAEFGSPIQLSFGFTLSGVGGLLGLHRTMLLQPLAEGVRTGAVNSVMFPTNVVENAPRIISDLRSFFPPHEGIFLIGPMAKIGWGTPNLVTLSLGIIIEIPGNIAILGVLKVALPDEDAALLVLQVNFIGAIEFDKKRVWFFASLFESRVLFMTIEGEMGLLVAWGDDANFVVSVGGFHPAFKAPPLPFPEPRRIAISILNTDFARIRVEGYFAVTSNTVQFGARAELYFGLNAFNIDGHLAFDALFQFSPFYFIIQISASLSVKVFGIGLFSVRFRGSLEGPTPWRVEGTGSISLLFFDIDVDFSHTWGEEADTTLPPIKVVPLVVAEFQKLENWKTTLPDQTRLFVSLRKLEATTDLVLHPVGTLQISQRAIPLELQLDKVGNQKPEDANYFTVNVTSPGLAKKGDVNESFAMAQFKNMDDSKKLSSPAYEKWKAGVELSAATAQANTSLAVKGVVRYEKIIIDTNYKRFVKPLFVWFANLFTLFLNGNAVARSSVSQHYFKQKQPFEEKVTIHSDIWVVASNADNSPLHATAGSFTSQAKAYEYMQQRITEKPELADNVHVIPQTELRKAA